MATSVAAVLTRSLSVLGRNYANTVTNIAGASDVAIERTVVAADTFTVIGSAFPIAKILLIYIATDQSDVDVVFASGSGNTTITVPKGSPFTWDAVTGGVCPVLHDCTGMTIHNNGAQAVDSDVHGLVILSA